MVLTLIMLADYLGVFCYLLKEMLMVSVVSKVGEPCLRVVTPVHVNGIHTNEVTGEATGQEGNIQGAKVLFAVTVIDPEVGLRIINLDAEVIVTFAVSLD